jgi:hypothetical protein
VVLSKGCEVVGLSYMRVTAVAAMITDKRENLGNHGQVNRVSKMEQHYPNSVSQNSNTDWQVDRIGRVSQVCQVTQLAQAAAWIDK